MGLFQICAENSVGNKGIFVISEQHLQRVKAFLAYPRNGARGKRHRLKHRKKMQRKVAIHIQKLEGRL